MPPDSKFNAINSLMAEKGTIQDSGLSIKKKQFRKGGGGALIEITDLSPGNRISKNSTHSIANLLPNKRVTLG